MSKTVKFLISGLIFLVGLALIVAPGAPIFGDSYLPAAPIVVLIGAMLCALGVSVFLSNLVLVEAFGQINIPLPGGTAPIELKGATLVFFVLLASLGAVAQNTGIYNNYEYAKKYKSTVSSLEKTKEENEVLKLIHANRRTKEEIKILRLAVNCDGGDLYDLKHWHRNRPDDETEKSKNKNSPLAVGVNKATYYLGSQNAAFENTFFFVELSIGSDGIISADIDIDETFNRKNLCDRKGLTLTASTPTGAPETELDLKASD